MTCSRLVRAIHLVCHRNIIIVLHIAMGLRQTIYIVIGYCTVEDSYFCPLNFGKYVCKCIRDGTRKLHTVFQKWTETFLNMMCISLKLVHHFAGARGWEGCHFASISPKQMKGFFFFSEIVIKERELKIAIKERVLKSQT